MTAFPPARTLLGRVLRLPLWLTPKDRALRVVSGRLRGSLWISSSHTHGCWLGTYERELQRALAGSLRPGDVLYDVGANVGFFALLGSALVGASGRVIAFEPLPRNLALLRRHVELNARTNVTIIPAAVADAPGEGYLSETRSSAQGSLSSAGVSVRVVTLDELLAAGTIPAPTVLKIDVEGAESRVLAGAGHILSMHHPTVFLSAHGHLQQESCWRTLSEHGYRITLRRDGRFDGQYESVATFPSEAA